MPPPGRGGRGGGAGARGGSGSASPPGGRGRGRGRGGASVTFEVPISRPHQAVHFKASNSRRGRGARKTRRGRSNGRPQSPPCQDYAAEQTPLSCSSKLLGTLKGSSTSTTSSSSSQALLRDTTEISASPGRCLSSSPGSTILLYEHPDWYLKFYIRIAPSKSFHIYPNVAGPFNTLKEAENAIDCYLDRLQDEKMRKESLDKLSPMDWLIRQSLYWPDGTRRKCSEASAIKNTCKETGALLKALVDKYTDDKKLSGDDAYELKDVLHYQTMREGNIWYSHFNFTAKKKGAGGIGNLFFAEVMGGDEMVVSCFCMINTDANGCCYGCTNNGSVGMKHPNEADTYKAGRSGSYLLSERTGAWHVSDDDEDVKAEEDRLRYIFKGLDDPEYRKKISKSPHATATFY